MDTIYRGLLKYLSIIILLTHFNHTSAQTKLYVVDTTTSNKILFKENNLVTIGLQNSIDTLKKRVGFVKITGRIRAISDSSLTIKKAFSKKEVSIRLSEIYKIRKEKASKFIIKGLLGAATVTVSMFVFEGPHIGALAFIPLSLGVDLFYPYKTLGNRYVFEVNQNHSQSR